MLPPPSVPSAPEVWERRAPVGARSAPEPERDWPASPVEATPADFADPEPSLAGEPRSLNRLGPVTTWAVGASVTVALATVATTVAELVGVIRTAVGGVTTAGGAVAIPVGAAWVGETGTMVVTTGAALGASVGAVV